MDLRFSNDLTVMFVDGWGSTVEKERKLDFRTCLGSSIKSSLRRKV
jgi:hypothetical protein